MAGEDLDSEEALRTIIRDTITDICSTSNKNYGNICGLASRSPEDKKKVIDKVFDVMTEPETGLKLTEALAQVDSQISF